MQVKRQQLPFADKRTHTRRNPCIGKAAWGSRPSHPPARRACASASVRRRTLAKSKHSDMLCNHAGSDKAARSLCGDRVAPHGAASEMHAGVAPNEWRPACTSPGRHRSHSTRPDQSSICPGWPCSGSRRKDIARDTACSRYNGPNPLSRCIRRGKRLASSRCRLARDTPCSPGRSCTVRR